jgi:hypothetical protein
MADDVLAIEARLKDYISGSLAQLETNVKKFTETTKKTFDDVGKSTKKTGESLEQQYNKIINDSNKAGKSMDSIGGKSKGLSSIMGGELTSALTNVVKGFAAFEIAKRTISFLIESGRAANEVAIIEAKLATALGYRSRALVEQANILQSKTGVDAEEIKSSQSLLASYIKNEDAVKKLTPAIIDFAAATGIDLKTAATQVARAIQDDSNEMGRWKISVEGAKGSTERMNSLMKGLNEKFGGQAKAMMDAEDGSKRLSQSMGDLMETIGAGVNESLKPMKEFLSDVIDKIDELWKAGRGKTIFDDEKKVFENRKKMLEEQLVQAKNVANNPWAIYASGAITKMKELEKELDIVNKKLGVDSGGVSSKEPTKIPSGFRPSPTGGFVEDVPINSMAAENRAKDYEKGMKEFLSVKKRIESESLRIERESSVHIIEQRKILDQAILDSMEEGYEKQRVAARQDYESKIAEVDFGSQAEILLKKNLESKLTAITREETANRVAIAKYEKEQKIIFTQTLASGVMGIARAAAESTIKDAKKRQGVIAAMTMAEGLGSAMIAFSEAWKSKGTGGFWAKLGIAIGTAASVTAYTIGQVAAIKNQKFANGTGFAGGGMSLVGEQGPELVDIPRGSRVYTHNETKNMMGGNTININIPLGTSVDMRAATSIRESAKYIGEVLMQAEYEGRLEKVKAVLR